MKKTYVVLLAEGDVVDRAQIRSALKGCGIPLDVRVVRSGEELLQYLRWQGRFNAPDLAPTPDVVLLGMSGSMVDAALALEEMTLSSELDSIPVIVLTRATPPHHLANVYGRDHMAYLVKPVDHLCLRDAMRTLGLARPAEIEPP
jgi:CheY-like chemotaxis protein